MKAWDRQSKHSPCFIHLKKSPHVVFTVFALHLIICTNLTFGTRARAGVWGLVHVQVILFSTLMGAKDISPYGAPCALYQ